jgi:hypothetical protein
VHVAGLGDIPERRTVLLRLEHSLPVAVAECLSEDVACLKEDGSLGRGFVKSLSAPEENDRR